MRPSITVGLFLCVALGATATACRDSAPAQPQAFDNHQAKTGGESGSSDDSSATEQPTPPTAPAQPGPGPDTAIGPPAPTATRPAAFTIDGVALGVEQGADTTQTVGVGGVTVRLYRVKAADGSPVTETLVGTTIADANGEFVFRDVASAHYRLDVQTPAASPYPDGSVSIVPPWSAQIRIAVVLRRTR